jgi:hypothetical protein
VTIGCTATASGLTEEQISSIRHLFEKFRFDILHHGDCVGGDKQIHDIAREFEGVWIEAHPPIRETFRAFCTADRMHPIKGYLARNRDIVRAAVDGMIVAPRNNVRPSNTRGEGTWTTYNYSLQAHRRIWLVLPNGTIQEDQ